MYKIEKCALPEKLKNGDYVFKLVVLSSFHKVGEMPIRFRADIFKCKSEKHALIKGLLSYYKWKGEIVPRSDMVYFLGKNLDDLFGYCAQIGLGVMFYDRVGGVDFACGVGITIYQNADDFYFK